MVASDLSVLARRFAWLFGVAGLLIPLLIDAAWWLGWMEQIIPHYLLDWVILVWPWSRLLIHAEEASLPLAFLNPGDHRGAERPALCGGGRFGGSPYRARGAPVMRERARYGFALTTTLHPTNFMPNR